MFASISLPETFRCRQRHAHLTAERSESCDARYFDRKGYEKLEAVEFAPPPRVLIREFPGIPALIDGKLEVIVFSAEQILPHEGA